MMHVLSVPLCGAVVIPQSSQSGTSARNFLRPTPLHSHMHTLFPFLPTAACYAEDTADTEQEDQPTVADDLGASREASRTDAEAVERYSWLLTPPPFSCPPFNLPLLSIDVSNFSVWHVSLTYFLPPPTLSTLSFPSP